MTVPLFITSGDLIADRRYEMARAYAADGDLGAAADLFAQAVELAPGFASAWFALGETRDALGDRDGAREAFAKAQAADPDDLLGAALHLVRLGVDPDTAELHGYVRVLFNQYAPRFDRALSELSYSAPAMIYDAIMDACRAAGDRPHFLSMLDLGCGTGLAAVPFRPHVQWLVGFDLSPDMVAEARRKEIYDRVWVGEIEQTLVAQHAEKVTYRVVVAADVFAYMGDLDAVCEAVARVLAPRGWFAFTVETHDGDGVIVGPKMRYQHGIKSVRRAVAAANLTLVQLTHASTRTENRVPVPGLLVVAQKR